VANTRRVMYEQPNHFILSLLETIDRGVDNACSCDCDYLHRCVLFVAQIRSGCVMVGQACGFCMGVSRFSTPHRRVAVLEIPDARLDATRRIESA
jgi:hypothetical protein